jgi:hypothetical protein
MKSDVALSSTTVGHKDMGKNIFDIWKELFTAPNNKKRVYNKLKQNNNTLFEGTIQ